MKTIKKYISFIKENYKSDDDIEKEFAYFTIEEIKFEMKDLSHVYTKNTYRGDVVFNFPNGDESVGGGSNTTSEDFVYNTTSYTFKFQISNWYPENIHKQMINMIASELNKKYEVNFKHLTSNEFNNLNS